jgi:hypothetical protein
LGEKGVFQQYRPKADIKSVSDADTNGRRVENVSFTTALVHEAGKRSSYEHKMKAASQLWTTVIAQPMFREQ